MTKGKSTGLIVGAVGGELVPRALHKDESHDTFDSRERMALLKQNEELKERIEREKEEERRKLQLQMEEERRRLQEENKREIERMEKEREESESMKQKIMELQLLLKERDQTNQERDDARKEAM